MASCSPTFEGNIFYLNTARLGGGIYVWYSHSPFTNNVFLDNHATSSGSGLYPGGSSFTMLHTTFSMNSGGDGSGLFVDKASTTPAVWRSPTRCWSAPRWGSASQGSTAHIDGILWFGTPITVSQGTATVAIQHEHTGDPAFDSDGYHLTSASAAIHTGVPAGLLVDIDGQPRSVAAPDLGADEFWLLGNPRELFLPAVMR